MANSKGTIMELNGKLFDYLKKHLKDFTKTTKKGAYLFTCPNVDNHKYVAKSPTATIINGSDKIHCIQCSFTGTFYDIVRTVEKDKAKWTDEQIVEYLINSTKIDMYSELDKYVSYNWSLIPVAKNGKNPLEKDWTNKTHYDKMEWLRWLNNGCNLGVRTGEISNITAIDVDLKESPTQEVEEVMQLLKKADTLVQNSPHGLHYVFQYDPELPQTVNIGNLHIDIRNDRGQILVQPSQRDNLNYHWKNLGKEIKPLSKEIKDKLLSHLKVDKGRSNIDPIPKDTEKKLQVVKEGERNSSLISLGGILIKQFTPEQTQFILTLMNQNFFTPPLPSFEIEAMMGSLAGYKETDESTQEEKIYKYLKAMQCDITANDIVLSCFDGDKKKRGIVDKYLSKFAQEGKAIRLSRGRYKWREKISWSDQFSSINDTYKYTIPYFEDVMYFENGDIILLGGTTNSGKSTIALNFVKRMVDQGVKPYLINLESGSRFYKTAKSLGLKEGDFYHTFHSNPLAIEIEPESFTIVDWLFLGEDYSATENILKHLNDEMERKGGILVVFTQLKEDYNWFAPNLIKNFPALAARYIYDDDVGATGHWHCDKIKEPKGNYKTYDVQCKYNFDTKEFENRKLL